MCIMPIVTSPPRTNAQWKQRILLARQGIFQPDPIPTVEYVVLDNGVEVFRDKDYLRAVGFTMLAREANQSNSRFRLTEANFITTKK